MCLLRYPGGKQRAAKKLVSYVPRGIKVLYSPFFGGGSVELEWLEQNPEGQIQARDAFLPLVNFWQQVLAGKGPEMAQRAREYLPIDKGTFYQLQGLIRNTVGDPLQRAVWFYVVNRSSFSGSTLSGGMGDGSRFTESACQRLEDFVPPKGLHFRSGDVFDSLRRRTDRFTEDTCIYLDPPYWLEGNGNKLYGDKGNTHEGFDHLRLRRLLGKLDDQGVKWVMSYNHCPAIQELYEGFKKIPARWKYGMSADKNGKELIILSRNI